MRSRIAVAVALVVTVSACGGAPTAKPAGEPTAGSTSGALKGSLPNVDGGRVVPDALREFTCTRDDEGRWTASGAVVNASTKATTFQVTAHVGPADGQGATARTKRIAAIQPKGSVRFDLGELQGTSDGPCHVRVVALAS